MADKHLVRSKSGLRFVSKNESDRSPFHLLEPPWIPDNQCLTCQKCNSKFDFLKRRHHCRRCGQVFCGSCCSTKVPLPRMLFVDPVRLCDECAPVTRKENDFFDRHLKTLQTGGHFITKSSVFSDADREESYLCKISSDQRSINFDGSSAAQHDSIDLVNVGSVQILTSGPDSLGNTVPSGIAVQYVDSCGESQHIKLMAASVPNKKQSMVWVAAMQKAFKLIYESRKS